METKGSLNIKIKYLQNLCEITFADISEELINACEIDINFDLKENVQSLIKVDQDINQLKKRIRKVCSTNKELVDECRDLYNKLFLVHKAIYETMKTEFGIVDCWENENGTLGYARY